MKSEYTIVHGLAMACLQDIAILHPAIVPELRRDYTRLLKASQVSGLSFYTITLPVISKFLERSLDDKVLGDARPPYTRAKSRTDKRPELFHGLWSLVFESDGTLMPDADELAISSLRQILLFAKKLKVECDRRFLDESIDTFVETEKSLPPAWDLTWDDDRPEWCHRFGHPIWGPSGDRSDQNDLFNSDPVYRYCDDLTWERFRRLCLRVVSEFGQVDIYDPVFVPGRNTTPRGLAARQRYQVLRPKHGPGAVSDKHDGTKYDHLFWTAKMEPVFPYDHFGCPNMGFSGDVVYREFPSQLSAVPKTATGPRLIASEPTCHQWMQGAVDNWIRDRLKSHSLLSKAIALNDQVPSQELALGSSASGEYATVDLKSASDRLSCRLVEYVFQGNRSLLDCMHACRTRVVQIRDRDGLQLRLNKFSTQGSALTFPIQTIVFTTIAAFSIMLAEEADGIYSADESIFSRVRVYGDDIIIPTHAYPVLCDLIRSLLLSVNTSKSFAHGKFRESCGMDAYNGVDVTPAYLRAVYKPKDPESLDSVVKCSNNFFMKGFWHSANFILTTVPPEELRLLPVVPIGSGSLGPVSFSGGTTRHLKRRWNKYLHRWECRVISVSPVLEVKRGKGHGDLNQFFNEFTHKESLTDITPYRGGQVSALRHRKVVRWVPVEEAGGM